MKMALFQVFVGIDVSRDSPARLRLATLSRGRRFPLGALAPVIPMLSDQNLCAQSRKPMDMIAQG